MVETHSEPGTEAPAIWRRVLAHPIVRLIYELAAYLLLVYSIKEFAIKPLLTLLGVEEVWRRNIQGLLTIGLAFAVYYLIVRFLERRQATELAIRQMPTEGVLGTLLGFAAVSLSFLLLFLLGVFSISGLSRDFAIVYPVIWVFLLSMNEELMFRGFLYRIAEENLGTHWALAISAIPFGLIHVTNAPGEPLLAVSALCGGLVVGILFTLTKRLWLPIFFHAAWNFSQVIYGSNVSATDMFGKVLESEMRGPDWLTGGATGMEGSVLTILMVLALFVALYWWAHQSRRIVPRRSRT